jgi:hypothetical protein
MGLLNSIYSASNTAKRRLNGLLSDPVGTLSLGATRFAEDNNSLLNTMANAYPMAGDKTVLNNPQQISQFRSQLADKGTEMAMAGMMTTPSYRGGHTAPMKNNGNAPLYDLTQRYPDDIYSSKAAQYYGHYGGGDIADRQAVALMQAAKGKPDMPVTMYRAVPYEKTVSRQVAELEKQMATYQQRGNVPKGSYLTGGDWYENASNMRDRLIAKADSQTPEKLSINNGDWVTLSKQYAKEHGEGALNGNYKILSQKVPARKLFTDGNSIQEFGYDESGKINVNLLAALAGGGLLGLGGYKATQDK